MTFRSAALSALVTVSSACGSPVWGQDSLRVLQRNGDGSYSVQIGRDTLLAIPVEWARRAILSATERSQLQRDVQYRDTLLALYRLGGRLADSALARCKEYSFQVDSLYRGYRSLAEGYRRLSRDAWLTLDGGLGASGSDRSPAVLLGLGIRRVRLWGFFQERNSGGFLGVSLRLF